MSSDQQVKEVTEVDVLYDFKAWLLPHIDTPHGHTNPHNFLFHIGEDGKAEMKYRNWSSDPWMPTSPQPGIVLLKVSFMINSISCI